MHVGLANFFQNLTDSGKSDAELYLRGLAFAELAEDLGFDGVWAPEHHFTGYHMVPNVLQFLTWVAARTKRVKLGTMVVVTPWHDPMWMAEQLAMLDNMSGGRLVLGMGRGLGPQEFRGYRIDMTQSRQLFLEHGEALLRGFESGYMEYDGELYKQPRTEIRPRPLRSLRGRAYASSNSPESMAVMAKLGVGVMIFVQRPWEVVDREIAGYRQVYGEANGGEPPKPLIASFVAVHESEGAAKEIHERYTAAYFRSAIDHYEFADPKLATVPGYESYGGISKVIAESGPEGLCRGMASLQPWGTPSQVAEQLIAGIERVDGGGVLCAFDYGGMPAEIADANVRLFAEKVLPLLRSHDAGFSVASGIAR